MEFIASFTLSRMPAARAWDHQALDDFDGLRDFVFRLAYSLTLNYSVAEDLAQDCLIRIWQNRDTLREVDAPQAWITRVVVNRVRTHWRRQTSWLPFHKVEVIAEEADPNLVILRLAMQNLPTDCREIALMVGVYGASYAEVGLALGIPEGTVGSRFHRAKKLLRDALGGEGSLGNE